VPAVRLDPPELAEGQLAALVAEARGAGRDVLVVEAEPTPDELGRQLDDAGFDLVRTTLQLRVALPLAADRRGRHPDIVVRPFVVGVDEPAWLAVNNRAFAWHPDQANQTLERLQELEAEPWFRADGFLLHHDPDGQLDGFCWTKVHAAHQPPLGEIYVIGVDPDHHGSGLGRALVLAGLDWLGAQGLTHGMLYVEADNQPALGLYRSLGFTEHQAHRWWRLDLTGNEPVGQ
jgi:mycothiol synthase